MLILPIIPPVRKTSNIAVQARARWLERVDGMWTRRSIVLGGMTTTVAGCSPWENYRFNYVLRIAAEVAGERVGGSSVIHLGFYNNGFMKGFDAVGAYSVYADGEAPILETPKGKMFALLWGENLSRFHPLEGYAALRSHLDQYAGIAEVSHFRGPVALAADSWPLLVNFSSLADPATAQLIWSPTADPSAQTDTRMISATVEVTDNDVTHRLGPLLPWLADLGGNRLTGDKYGSAKDSRFARNLTKRDFEMRGDETGQI